MVIAPAPAPATATVKPGRRRRSRHFAFCAGVSRSSGWVEDRHKAQMLWVVTVKNKQRTRRVVVDAIPIQTPGDETNVPTARTPPTCSARGSRSRRRTSSISGSTVTPTPIRLIRQEHSDRRRKVYTPPPTDNKTKPQIRTKHGYSTRHKSVFRAAPVLCTSALHDILAAAQADPSRIAQGGGYLPTTD